MSSPSIVASITAWLEPVSSDCPDGAQCESGSCLKSKLELISVEPIDEEDDDSGGTETNRSESDE